MHQGLHGQMCRTRLEAIYCKYLIWTIFIFRFVVANLLFQFN
jgi:hypothetical protein